MWENTWVIGNAYQQKKKKRTCWLLSWTNEIWPCALIPFHQTSWRQTETRLVNCNKGKSKAAVTAAAATVQSLDQTTAEPWTPLSHNERLSDSLAPADAGFFTGLPTYTYLPAQPSDHSLHWLARKTVLARFISSRTVLSQLDRQTKLSTSTCPFNSSINVIAITQISYGTT